MPERLVLSKVVKPHAAEPALEPAKHLTGQKAAKAAIHKQHLGTDKRPQQSPRAAAVSRLRQSLLSSGPGSFSTLWTWCGDTGDTAWSLQDPSMEHTAHTAIALPVLW